MSSDLVSERHVRFVRHRIQNLCSFIKLRRLSFLILFSIIFFAPVRSKGQVISLFLDSGKSSDLKQLENGAANKKIENENLNFSPSATFVVNSTTDTADANTTDNLCDVDLTAPGQQCTLRAALQQADANGSSLDVINFNIPGSGVRTITLSGAVFGTVINPVTIDGYTQPGASRNTLPIGNNAVLLIEIRSTFAINISRGSLITGIIFNRAPAATAALHFFWRVPDQRASPGAGSV